MKDYSLQGKEYIELISLLQLVQVCDSGGQAKFRVSEGDVKVDGEVESRKRRKLRDGVVVEIDDLAFQIKA